MDLTWLAAIPFWMGLLFMTPISIGAGILLGKGMRELDGFSIATGLSLLILNFLFWIVRAVVIISMAGG